jgi:hypothetical protein
MSYYILGVVVAFVHTYPRTSRGMIPTVISSLIWPLTVPVAPFFWLYFWYRKPRTEQDLIDQHCRESYLVCQVKVAQAVEELRKEGRIR